MALIRTNVRQRTEASLNRKAPTGDGYGPADFQSAYKLPSSTAGAGATVAVIEAFDDPNAESDLALYRTQFGRGVRAPQTPWQKSKSPRLRSFRHRAAQLH